jgi:hypothetical protein
VVLKFPVAGRSLFATYAPGDRGCGLGAAARLSALNANCRLELTQGPGGMPFLVISAATPIQKDRELAVAYVHLHPGRQVALARCTGCPAAQS